MTQVTKLQDFLQRGLGRAAVALGAWCDAYRPDGADDPLAAKHRVMRMHASFSPPGKAFLSPEGYGQAIWLGIFDAAYTRAGDYIVREESRSGALDGGVWFIAAQQPLLPVLCVRASRVVTMARPAAAGAPGLNDYGGVSLASAAKLLTRWPASVLSMRGSGLDRTDLPADAADATWHALLPAVPGVVLRSGDLMTDDLGRTGVVGSAELSELGWRLLVKQAAT
jgi:hypothetical protein